MPSSILWFRQDLRVSDQAALIAAAQEGPVIPVYVLDDETPGKWAIGGAQRWWLHHSLASLSRSLEDLGSRLILRRGRCVEVLRQIAQEAGATRVHALHHYEPWWRAAEQEVAGSVELVLHHGNQLAPPDSIRTNAGRPFRIFGPFQRALSTHMPPPKPRPAPKRLTKPPVEIASEVLDDWNLLPTRPNWASEFPDRWTPGETQAMALLEDFARRADVYADRRNHPSEAGTSSLSPHLHFGEVSPATVWHRLAGGKADKFLSEVSWRDFAQALILADPAIGERHQRTDFDRFPYRTGADAEADFRAWRKGQTGYPIVDAGMRELWRTGWMHNRVRLLTATLLVKHLLIDWRRGAEYLWDTLVDADYGNNSQNWQWVAGTGVDSSPFYRVMAPITQSQKFEAAGYIRRWVPELAHLSDHDIHDPHARGMAPPDYPAPLIPHAEARTRALAAYRAFRANA